MSETTLTETAKNKALQLGADLVGIADLDRLQGIPAIPDNLLSGFTRAVVVAVAGQPIPNRCGKCRNCVEACPAGAIRGASWEYHPETREVALDFAKCVDKLTKDFAQRPLIGKPICGVCIKVCPWSGRK
ncbi:MAG: 4Fe-4S dicluster domain-containing protein [Clostridia bacterium]|nr:4Fe-4S dicluster domain-containing protein [Clostridia bacterium]